MAQTYFPLSQTTLDWDHSVPYRGKIFQNNITFYLVISKIVYIFTEHLKHTTMIKLSVPTFDNDINFVGDVTIEVEDVIEHKDYSRISNLLPGTPCGYCSAIAIIGQTKQPVEITRFYDLRQKGVKKLKGYFIKVL